MPTAGVRGQDAEAVAGHTPVAVATYYGLEFLGFLLAAIAYWDAAAPLRTSGPDPSTTEVDLLTA